jgi:hypothetical protein
VLGQYLRGQLLVMLIMAVFYAWAWRCSAWTWRCPSASSPAWRCSCPTSASASGLMLAVLAGLLEFASLKALVMVAVVYGVGQVLESFYLTPRLVGERIGLHPLAVIFALLAFGQMFGFVGVLVALPASAVLLVAHTPRRSGYLASRLYQGMRCDAGMKQAGMKQIALDIGLARPHAWPIFWPAPTKPRWRTCSCGPAARLRSPVPTYLWGDTASGKTHLLQGRARDLREQGASSGWLDASMLEPPEFDEPGPCVLLDDVHLYTAVQQQAAFNWFVSAQRPRRPARRAGRRQCAAGRPGAARGPAHPPRLGPCVRLQALTEPERRAVLRQRPMRAACS